MNLQERGSQTAKDGFRNEQDIVNKFNNWEQDKNARWILKPINFVINFFDNGPVVITPRGSVKIGRITMQRKGGDGGRETAKMLQFKINPAELFEK